MRGDAAFGVTAKVVMPGFGAEMRQVDLGHAVGRQHLQDAANRHGQQAFAGFEDRQRAQKPGAINLGVKIHVVPVLAASIPTLDRLRQCQIADGDVTGTEPGAA